MRARVPDGSLDPRFRAPGCERLQGTRYRHPLGIAPRTMPRFRLYFARHATLEAGTGLVHTAPGHGADDYVVGAPGRPADLRAGRRVGKAAPRTSPTSAGSAGVRRQPEDRAAAGRDRLPAQQARPVGAPPVPTLLALQDPDRLPRHRAVVRAPRRGATDATSLRAEALAEIGHTQWIPTWGENRIRGMIEARPDWCLSRQRVWGVPIPAFRCGKCGKDLLEPDVMEHVAEVFLKEGSNAWFTLAGVGPGAARHQLQRVRQPRAREAGRHRRRLVRVGRLVGRGRRRQARRRGRQGRPLPRGRRPAPRLVPLVAADVGGDAPPGAVQGAC